jgi:hypothetical protein
LAESGERTRRKIAKETEQEERVEIKWRKAKEEEQGYVESLEWSNLR